ncbi:MAG: PAS domain S-box protein [Calditrichota bacterium]
MAKNDRQIAQLTREIERLRRKVSENENRRWLESFPNENPTPVMACSAEGDLFYMNPAAKRMLKRLGLKRGEDLLPFKHRQLVQTSFLSRGHITAHKRIAERDFEWYYHGVKKIGICQLFAHDVTKHERTKTALQDSELWFRAVVENLSEGLLVTDLDEKIVYVNYRLAQMLGYSVKSLLGSAAESLWPEDLRAAVNQKTVERHHGDSDRYETELLRSDGQRIWVKVSAAPYRDSKGKITGCFGVFTDIMDIKRADEEREKLEVQIRRTQKLETIGTLAGGIAHDFNNILTPILGYADMARMDIPSGGVARSSLEHVIQAAYRAKDLVRQILTFSRQSEQERKPVRIHTVVKEALKLMRASLPVTIEIHEDIDRNCGAILADPSRIHQVLMNLCTNAFHAMRESGGVLEIKLGNVEVDNELVKTRPNLHVGRYVRLTVGDTGHGMDGRTIERIFEPFFTTKEVGEGTGLGLSVVHGIIMDHGGDISVYSEPGRGTTFHIYLPIVEEDRKPEILDDETTAHGTENVLFVDDNREIAYMGKRMLERLGYKVTVRTSSVEALEAFRARPKRYDVVITDQTMPHMTGDQLARELVLIRPDIPIVLITGFSETISSKTNGRSGIRQFVMKPIVLHELSQAIRKAIDSLPVE